MLNQGNHQVSEGSGPGSESQSGGGEVRLSAQRPSLLDPRPERPLGAHFSPAPRPRHSCAVGPLAAAQPDRLRSGAPSPAAQARSPGTCGRAVPAAAQLPAPAEPIARARLPSQVSISPPGAGGAGRPRSEPSAHRPRTQTQRLALTGLDSAAARAFPGGSMALPDPPGRRAAQHRPENGRRLGSASPARPRRWALAAARPGGGRPDPLHRGPVLQGARRALAGAPGGEQRDPGAPTEAPRSPRPTQRTAASASTFSGENKPEPAEGQPA